MCSWELKGWLIRGKGPIIDLKNRLLTTSYCFLSHGFVCDSRHVGSTKGREIQWQRTIDLSVLSLGVRNEEK